MPFDRQNYRLLLGALALVVLGYALMLIDNAREASSVDSALSLYVAPLLLLAGYVGVAGAVLWGVPREADPTADDVPADDALVADPVA
jgi:hypothetical protein